MAAVVIFKLVEILEHPATSSAIDDAAEVFLETCVIIYEIRTVV